MVSSPLHFLHCPSPLLLSLCQSVRQSVSASVCFSQCVSLSVFLSVCFSQSVSVCLCLSVPLSVSELFSVPAILQDCRPHNKSWPTLMQAPKQCRVVNILSLCTQKGMFELVYSSFLTFHSCRFRTTTTTTGFSLPGRPVALLFGSSSGDGYKIQLNPTENMSTLAAVKIGAAQRCM